MSIKMPILRYYVPEEQRGKHLGELIETCDCLGLNEVLLFTADYLRGAPFVDKEGLKRRMEHLHLCAKEIRKAGLVFSLNVVHSLGHIRVPEEIVQRFGFRRQIRLDGRPAVHPVLDPSCPNLRRHLAEAYEAYAILEPRLIFVDDDYKMDLGSCFYSGRLEEFAERFGCAPSREAIQSLLFSENAEKARKARMVMWELINRDLDELALILREAVHRISPETRLGLMFSGGLFDVQRIAETLAGTHRPYVRPQIPLYREELPVSKYSQAFWSLTRWKAKLPENFEFFPEVDNYPYNDFVKSPSAVFAHIAACFGYGETAVALSLNSFSSGIPAGESRRSIEYVTSHRPQLKRLVDYLDGGSESIGIGLWETSDRSTANWRLPRVPLSQLQLLGLPFYAVRQPEQATVHFGMELCGADDKQMGKVLSRGAVFDLDSVRVLKEKGLLSRAGLNVGTTCPDEEVSGVLFSRSDGSKEYWPIHYFIREVPVEGMPIWIDSSQADLIASYWNWAGEKTVPFAMTWVGPEEQHFACINFSLRLWPLFAWLNPWMGKIFSRLVEWAESSSIPVKVERCPLVTIQASRLLTNRSLFLVLTNFSTGSYESIYLSLSPKWKEMHLVEIMPEGQEEKIPVSSRGNTAFLELKGKTKCLDVRFVLGRMEA